MIRNRLYYAIKPFVPLSIRRGVRRWFALRRLSKVQDQWPILPGSETPPAHWHGWPGKKRFAFVLTHDVEGQVGMDKCKQLMELEMRLGFVSSFNFVPEGPYAVPSDFLKGLSDSGFEVGVHDLHHDGRLYDNRRAFAEKAQRINRYIKSWNAVGFRSGFMLRKLDWLHDLEIEYDASTFDTDPFEPQPDGVGTLFPFWISNPAFKPAAGPTELGIANKRCEGGYIELPYTLAQDSTVFLLLRETSIEVWKRKLAWIAEKGGMALVNVHPDYINFRGGASPSHEFPVSFYEQFLQHVSQEYQGQYWHALPRDIARFWRGTRVTQSADSAQDASAKKAS